MRRASLSLLALLSVPLVAHAAKAANNPVRAVSAAELAAAEYSRALTALADGHPNVAAGRLRRVLDARPQDDDARLLLGELLLDQGMPSDARNVLQVGFGGRPARFGVPLARAMLASGDAEAALQTLTAMPSPPQGEAWRNALIGSAELAGGHTDRAIRGYRTALEAQPEQVVWSLALSRCLRAAGREREAQDVLQVLLRRDTLSDGERESTERELDALSGVH